MFLQGLLSVPHMMVLMALPIIVHNRMLNNNATGTDSHMEDEWEISVEYVPIATLSLGRDLNEDAITEGDDIYFECSISANPMVSDVSWTHNDKILAFDKSAGVIFDNQSLALMNLTKENEGNYSCQASNSIGDGSSNTVTLHVKYSPVCSRSQATTYVVEMGEVLALNCSVQANPLQASFSWSFNNSGELKDVPPEDFTPSSSYSILNYRPVASYVTLLCWADNVVGRQRDPCVFHIVSSVTVTIMFPDVPLLAEEVYEILCEVKGSRSPLTITWWIGDQQVFENNTETSLDGDVTKSILSLIPRPGDDGSVLKCIAEDNATNSSIEDKRHLVVHYIPIANISFEPKYVLEYWGNGFVETRDHYEENLREGDQTSFVCSISANPEVSHVSWSHNGKLLVNDPSTGLTLSNERLKIQSLTKEDSGTYSCHAHNVLGVSISNNVTLDMKYPPFCDPDQETTYYVPIGEEDEVACPVKANPPVEGVEWSGNMGWFGLTSYRSGRTYRVRTPENYGTWTCKANNTIGRQMEPCVIHVVPPEKPDPPSNCTIEVLAPVSLAAVCEAGSSSGLNQTFVLEAKQLLINTHIRPRSGCRAAIITSAEPSFLVEGLEGGQEYVVFIRAFNEVGYSQDRSFKVFIPLESDPSEAEVDLNKNIQSPTEAPSPGQQPTILAL